MANVMNPTTDERPEIVHLSNSERWMMFIGVWMALVASILAVMWRGLIWLIVGERAILLGSIGLLFSWVVQNRPPSRRLVNAFIVSALLVFFCLDMYIALGLMPHIAWLYMRQLFISLSTADALALGLSLIVTLYALRCFEIWDTVDAQLSLILGLAVFVLLLPVERSMWLLAFFAPYAIGALIVMLTSQNARIRACTSMIHISNWEQRMRRSFWHTVRDVGAWVLVVATLLSYFMTSFTRPTDWAARFQIELAERLARWLTRERAVITTYTFSVSLWRLPTGFSDTVVMRVTSNVPGYWRTCVFDYYSKGEWKHRLPWYKRYVRGETVINLPPTDDRVDARIKFIKVTQT
ncbi:MAG TPA: hypothetical protein EYP10_14280, partial [Armatimonadetes bacterium]|nr:hypothetical protein [Armatimonadota bacterium]